MDNDNKIYVTAEFCCNHMGSMDFAKKMIDTLASQKDDERVDIIKFQKRTPKLILSEEKYNAPHPNPENSFGRTYGEHREFLEFSVEQHRELKEYIESKNLIYASSVFDKNAFEELLTLNPVLMKIGGSNNTDLKLLKHIADVYDGEIHVSLGCTTREEERKILDALEKKIGNVILYACTSSYPALTGDICLLEVKKLKDEYGKYVKGIGFSGHHFGIYPDIAALALGATYFERHYTLDKTLKGTDQKISLDVLEFNQLVKALNDVNKDLTYKPSTILDCEQYVRDRMKQVSYLEV